MPRNIVALALMIISFSFALSAQEPGNEKKELAEKVASLYQKGDLEEAIEAGEKLVKLEKESNDTVSYVNSLINLARIKNAYFVALEKGMAGRRFSSAEAREIIEKINQNADDAEMLFRQALELNEQTGKEQTTQTADIKKDLAWLISHHSPSGEKTVSKSRARIDEAEKLLIDSIALNEQIRGKDADQTLSVVLDAGDFYYKYANFEKALPFYERFIQTDEQKHGADDAELVKALRPSANILFATFQEPEAAAMVKRIESITKIPEPLPQGEIDLHLRSKDAVAFSAPVIMKMNEDAEAFRNRLKAENRTLNANNISQKPRLIQIPVKIEIDETGKITKAVAQTTDDKLAAEAEAVVSKWMVRPFSFNGASRKMRGILVYLKPQ